MTTTTARLGVQHGGYDPTWPGYTATFDVLDEQERTVVRESWVQNVYRLTPDRLDGSGVVVDLGACFGAFTILAARMGAKRVIAVEPHQENYHRLCAHLAANDVGRHVGARHVAAGMPGRTVEVTGTGVTAQSRVLATGKPGVPTVSLDEIIETTGPVDVLKVDIEGAEYVLVAHATTATLSACRFIAMEWHAVGLGFDGESAIGYLVESLLHTHHIEVSGEPDVGGMLYASRR